MKTRRPIPKGLNSKTYPHVFKLVLVTHEETESGVATKPVLQQQEVIRLCHQLAPEKVKAKADSSKVVLSELDDIHLKIIGIYGNDEEIMHFLCEDCNFEESIYSLKENVREYPRGLYAFLAQPNILFVLFLQRHSTATDSGIDKNSVRFLRYLRELSTHIHVVFNSSQLKELERHEKQNYDDEEDESDEDVAYSKRLAPQKMLSVSSDDMKLLPEFSCNCNLEQSFDASESTDLLASYGHDGYAIFQTETSTAFRLQCRRPADFYASSSEFPTIESPEMVPIDLSLTGSKELLCLNCVSTPTERRVIAVIRESNKDCDKVHVFCGSEINRKRPIRTFSHIVPTVFAFFNRLMSWYNKQKKEICIFEVITVNKILKNAYSFSIPQNSNTDEIKFLEFMNKDGLLIVDCRNRGRIVDVNSKEMVAKFDLPDGLLDLCSISSTQLLCAHADSSSLSCSVLQTKVSAVSTVGATKIVKPNVHLQTLRIIKLDGHFYFTAINSDNSKLVSWRTITADDEQTKQAGRKLATPADMLKGFQAIYDEYSVRHCYETGVQPLSLSFPVNGSSTSFIRRVESSIRARIEGYLSKTKENLQKEVDKIVLKVVAFNARDAPNLQLSAGAVSLGNWIRQLVPTVPVQIARIEDHCLVPVKTDGCKLVENVATLEQLVPKMSFGLVETLFADAARKQLPIKVVSAQGKQSTGKSYFLNHLAGAHFDTSGWRCTEGIWMCAKILPELLLVLLDFEGRSTEERSVQEDCLLASFGAAFSSVVIMKNEIRMESSDIDFMSKALKEAAQRLSTGQSQSNAFFNGTLCVVLKDVSHNDKEAAGEVEKKIRNSMSGAIRNLSRDDSEILDDTDKLRKGIFDECSVICQRPLTHKHFSKGLNTVKVEIDRKSPISIPHREMVIAMKSVLASLHLNGVVNAEDTSYTVLEDCLDQHIENAVAFGALELSNDGNVIEDLTALERDRAVIEDRTESQHLGLRDAGLNLCIWITERKVNNTMQKIPFITEQHQQNLLETYRKKRNDRDKDDENWVLNLQKFYLALIERRIKRVTNWINLNLPNDRALNDTPKRRKQQFLELCDLRYFEPLRSIWKICKSVCSQKEAPDAPCLRLCIRLKDLCQCEAKGCDCCNCLEQSHLCHDPCFYCLRGRGCNWKNPNRCGFGAKHQGNHKCREEEHLCSQPCCKRDISHGCREFCEHSIVDDHSVHECKAEHKCREECSAPDCSYRCSLDLNHVVTDRDKVHDCGKKGCIVQCCMEGCNSICQNRDHFHGLAHLCSAEHHCVGHLCSAEGGRCNNELCGKLPCSLTIESGAIEHVGRHDCQTDHVCDEQCPCGCSEYCIRKLDKRQDKSTGQRAFSAHSGACSTSLHTFSNRTGKEFQETFKMLSQSERKAIQTGAISMANDAVREHLHREDPTTTVSDTDDQFGGLCDAGLELCKWSQEGSVNVNKRLIVLPSTAELLIRHYTNSCSTSRKGNDKLWTKKCQDFIYSVIDRRITRVTSWIEINFPARKRLSKKLVLALDRFIERYRKLYFSVLMNEWALCRNVCRQKTGNSMQCQRECLRLKSICSNDKSNCHCLEENHSCAESCENCLKSLGGVSSPKFCNLGAEHSIHVPHRCDAVSHQCKEDCSKWQARNCMKKCNINYETKHDQHLCSAGSKHKCKSVCSGCSDICDLEFEHDHSLHRCAKLHCVKSCEVKDCGSPCLEDHLHFLEEPESSHFCGNEHVCVARCSVNEGRCDITKLGTAQCSVRIPSKQRSHKESHYCGLAHYCNQKCSCCNDPCIRELKSQQTTTQEIVFTKHIGFCTTGKHTFADSEVTGLKQILDKMKATATQIMAVGFKEISNDESVAGIARGVTSELHPDFCGEKFHGHGDSREQIFRLCNIVEKQVVTHQLLVPLIDAFKKKRNRDNDSDSRWKKGLEDYIHNILEERKESVQKWYEKSLPQSKCLSSNLVITSLNEFRERCRIEIFDRIRGQWKLCSRICSKREEDSERCQRTCIKLATECVANDTEEGCDCLEDDHRCRHNCSLCVIECGVQNKRRSSLESRCRLGARHDNKQHLCNKTEHPCPEKCAKLMARGCLGNCSYNLENHPNSSHLCSSGSNHKCPAFCSAEKLGCTKQCDREFEHQLTQNGDLHFCGERQCVQTCRHAGCWRRCANEDHLHDLNNRDSHVCDKQEHDCDKTCNVQGGRCPGRRDASANPCVVPIYRSGISHEGPHFCGQTHLCGKRCPCCDAYCSKRLVSVEDVRQRITQFTNHEGLCNTDAHQTAKNLRIKNSLGYTEASCEGEWCGNVCIRLGRGHLHLVPCQEENMICTNHHEPDVSGQILDQVLHFNFWEHFAHFEDPCRDRGQQKIFSKCPMYCSSKTESEIELNSEGFCQGELWHADYSEDTDADGHVIGGHLFSCCHYKHIIVVVDCSYSMTLKMDTDEGVEATPSTSQLAACSKRTRLDMVKQATINFLKQLNNASKTFIVSVICFSNMAQVTIDSGDVATACQQLSTTEWTEVEHSGTQYIPAIDQVTLILRSRQSLKKRDDPFYKPAIFFLSDGQTNETDTDTIYMYSKVRELVERYDATFSTCLYGPDKDGARETLLKMSESGPGNFYEAPTGEKLQEDLNDFKASLYKTRTISGYN